MTNKTDANRNKRSGGTHSAKRLIAAASITITIGGAAGFLGEQLAAADSSNVAVAEAPSISVTYVAPAVSATTVTTATSTSVAPTATTAAAEPTAEATTEATATAEPTAIPTVQPTATPAAAQQPVIVARSRSSR